MHTFESLDGFIAFDLVDPPTSVGVTRLAPKILADGAQLLARSLTYQFATFERQVAGASAGINAKPDDRDAAIEAFVAEVTPLVAAGTFCTQAGRGLSDDALAPLRAADPRSELFWEHGAELRGLGVAVAADTALGGIDGRTVTVEAYDDTFPALVRAVAERGGRLVGVSSAAGFVAAPDGLDAEAAAQAWTAHGAALVDELGAQKVDAAELFAAEADALVVGSKAGLIDHEIAERVAARAVVPSGPVPVTAKALAFLRRAEVTVVPDFVATAGPLFAMWPDEGATIETVRAGAIVAIIAALGEVLDHADGPLLGSCYRAEAFLQTWQERLPFGRPIA
jgi:glutamate dehydrogenase/leucine dehydrogenase